MATHKPRKKSKGSWWANPIAFFSSGRWNRQSLPSQFASFSDPLADTIAEGVASGRLRRAPDRDMRLAARTIRDQARADGTEISAIPRVRELILQYPGFEPFQKIYARLLRETRQDEQSLGAWLGICLRYPASMDAFHAAVSLAARVHGPKVGLKLLRARFPSIPTRLEELLAYAEACDAVGATTERRAAFERLAGLFRKRRDSWLTAASWLEEEVGVNRTAVAIIRRLAMSTGVSPPVVSPVRLPTVVGDGERTDKVTPLSPSASVRVLGTLFDRIIEQRTASKPREGRRGAVLLLTGSLAPGGAERQLVNTAVGLSRMSLQERTLPDGMLLDPVKVVARSLRDRNDGAFYLSDLDRAGIEVESYRDLPDFAGKLAASAVRPALGALGYLPWSTAEAVIKLTDWLRAVEPEVVHIWQDGLVYAVGLAALLAGVPRIVLSGRSTPPPDRRERYPIEYDVIYRSLLKAPGVTLSVNSHYSAARYAEWLEIDVDRISVVKNGVSALAFEPDGATREMLADFRRRGSTTGITIGAVMRLDAVKRPLLWIDMAARIAAGIPDVRFIIVGDGPFRAKMERRAELLGIASRVLFVGRSNCVGYWLKMMDLLILVSEHEGLPNALIEAQLAGVPVLATAAGGVPETVLPEKTGIVMPVDAKPLDLAQAAVQLLSNRDRLKAMGGAARDWAREAFPLSGMLANTLALYAKAGDAPPVAVRHAPLVPTYREASIRYAES